MNCLHYHQRTLTKDELKRQSIASCKKLETSILELLLINEQTEPQKKLIY
jgi:hypothetical protein